MEAEFSSTLAIDTEGLNNFLSDEGVFGINAELLSVLEGYPDEQATFEIEEYLTFKNIEKDLESLSKEEMLNYYLDSKNLFHYRDQIKSFTFLT